MGDLIGRAAEPQSATARFSRPAGRRPDRWATGFVWGAWTLLLLAALALVWRYGQDVPFYDEWNMVAVLTGERPVDAAWLWSEHNGHRIPLPRLVLLALYRLGGNDFRAGMYVNVLAAAGLALALIAAARTVRGRASYADAFFPLLLLHWGHYENFLWTWQVTQVIPFLVAGIVLVIVARRGVRLPPGAVLLAGICLVLLPLCGMPGLVYVPALTAWLGYCGFLHWRSPGPRGRWAAVAAWAAVATSLALVLAYFLSYREAEHHTHVPVLLSAKTALQFLAGALGPVAIDFWPVSAIAVLGLLLPSAAVLGLAVWRGRPDRSRALGLLGFLTAAACLVASVGLGRPGYGFAGRYFLLATPLLCGVYFVWGTCTAPRTGRWAQAAGCVLAAALLPFNVRAGYEYARQHRDEVQAFLRDMQAGAPAPELLARHSHALCPSPYGEGMALHAWLGSCLRSLHQAGIGPFASLRPDPPPFRLIPLALPRAGDGRLPPSGPPFQLPLDPPRFVYGIRIRYARPVHSSWRTIHAEGSPLFLEVFWRKAGQQAFAPGQRYVHCWSYEPEEREVTVWVYDTIDRVGIDPDYRPGLFELSEVAVLVPTGS